jgi:hypothetical protein
MPPSIKDKGVFTRRDALKTLAAITGGMTLACLPRSWETPVVQVGALPIHAQGSAGNLAKIDDRFVPSTICDDYFQWYAEIHYNLLAIGEALHFEVEFSGGSGGIATLLFIDGDRDTLIGELGLTFCLDFGTHDRAILELWGTDVRGFETNHLTYHLTWPEPVSEPDEG